MLFRAHQAEEVQAAKKSHFVVIVDVVFLVVHNISLADAEYVFSELADEFVQALLLGDDCSLELDTAKDGPLVQNRDYIPQVMHIVVKICNK